MSNDKDPGFDPYGPPIVDPPQETAEAPDDELIPLQAFFAFDAEGTYLHGLYMGYDEVTIDEKIVPQFTIFDEEEGIVRFNGTEQTAILKQLPVGTKVKVTFVSEEKTSSNRKVKRFDIRVPRPMVGTIAQAAIAAGGFRPRALRAAAEEQTDAIGD